MPYPILNPWMRDAAEYAVDAAQRSFLFWDVLRERGNNYLDHLKQGQPPVLVFDHEMVLDGRTFDRPVNYAIVRILDRRSHQTDRRSSHRETLQDRRCTRKPRVDADRDPHKRPIVIIDPRAGHGPGIGGSKLDSQIGVALDFDHPVYFVLFFTDPEPGQTVADIQDAEVRFLEEVARLHPEAPRPAVIGNCQAGWATALIGADRPDVTGPMVFNGSPLSYWGGVEGAHPMRYRGGLAGGVWVTSLLSDLGNGQFDGAHLVAGFEDLNPANTWWTKLYRLYANVDTEASRFLEFEKWWGGFFKMNREEIHFIVDSLFIGNELEQGALELRDGKWIHLKNFKDPIVVFASGGDNITPPPQALNWIYKVYKSEQGIKDAGQVIVYLVHQKIGHLGIFVSGSVAKREHREIIGSVEMIDFLPPGLYEMVIEEGPSQPWMHDHRVRFEERTLQDILKLDDGLEDEAAFGPVLAVSRFSDLIYRTWISPWVRMATDEISAEWMRQLHPLRMQRYFFSDLNPAMVPVKATAKVIKNSRRPAAASNSFLAYQEVFSQSVKTLLDGYREARDLSLEFWFKSLYNHPWMTDLFAPDPPGADSGVPSARKTKKQKKPARPQRDLQFAEAVVRIILAVAGSDKSIDRRQFEAAATCFQESRRLKRLKIPEVKEMVKTQAAVLNKDPEAALKGLRDLLPTPKERREAFDIAKTIASVNAEIVDEEKEMLKQIGQILGIRLKR